MIGNFYLVLLNFLVVSLSFNNFSSQISRKAISYKLFSSPFSTSEECPVEVPLVLVVFSNSTDSSFVTKPLRKTVSWQEAFKKIQARIQWDQFNDKYDINHQGIPAIDILNIKNISTSQFADIQYPVVALVGISEIVPNELQQLASICSRAKAVTVYNCTKALFALERYGTFSLNQAPANKSFKLFDLQFNREYKADLKYYDLIKDLWTRNSLEDLLFMMYMLIDKYGGFPIKSVAPVTSAGSTSPKQIYCMIRYCSKELFNCFRDENCRKALNCLNKCKGNDQVCSYRCITSYESPAFEQFAYCILQKHNCMGNKASTPKYPNPHPLNTFRNKSLSFEDAENIFVGHLNYNNGSSLLSSRDSLEPWSWKVVCGQNPAYDYFSCQHQLFYRDEKGFWYDPVFKVTTLDNREVWRRRHYKVINGKTPGEFYFSVRDNGIVSGEFWKILDCDDNLNWAGRNNLVQFCCAEHLLWVVFHYCGSAPRAGTSYMGLLVVTRNGKWANEMLAQNSCSSSLSNRFQNVFERANISSWELFEVDNSNCNSPNNPPPLMYERSNRAQ